MCTIQCIYIYILRLQQLDLNSMILVIAKTPSFQSSRLSVGTCEDLHEMPASSAMKGTFLMARTNHSFQPPLCEDMSCKMLRVLGNVYMGVILHPHRGSSIDLTV